MRRTMRSLGEKIVKDIKRATRKQYSSEEKIRTVLDGVCGEVSIVELCRREGISQGLTETLHESGEDAPGWLRSACCQR